MAVTFRLDKIVARDFFFLFFSSPSPRLVLLKQHCILSMVVRKTQTTNYIFLNGVRLDPTSDHL